jgi:hypothetical protein
VSISGARVSAPDAPVELVADEWVVVKVGKRQVSVGRLVRD